MVRLDDFSQELRVIDRPEAAPNCWDFWYFFVFLSEFSCDRWWQLWKRRQRKKAMQRPSDEMTKWQRNICCSVSFMQNDFRSRPLGSSGSRGVIHLANKIQLSPNNGCHVNTVHDCYLVQRQTQMEAGDAFVDEGWSGDQWFSGQSIPWTSATWVMSDVCFNVEWNSECQFAQTASNCVSHMHCPYISGCQKPWSGAACSQSVRPPHVSWQRHCGRWRHRSDCEVPFAFHDVSFCFEFWLRKWRRKSKIIESSLISYSVAGSESWRAQGVPEGCPVKESILSPFMEGKVTCYNHVWTKVQSFDMFFC